MPERASRPCRKPGCPALVTTGYCSEHKSSSPAALTESRRGTAHRRGYTRRWSEYSKARLRQYPLCVGYPAGFHGERYTAAEVTDHIIAASKRPGLFWDPANHQSLCQDCNKRKAIAEEGGFGR